MWHRVWWIMLMDSVHLLEKKVKICYSLHCFYLFQSLLGALRILSSESIKYKKHSSFFCSQGRKYHLEPI